MRAAILTPSRELVLSEVQQPLASDNQVLLKVEACALCRTDLHIIDGELTPPKLPLILGHEIVGRVEKAGSPAAASLIGRRFGVTWLAQTCMQCAFCRGGQENLCDKALFTGFNVDGGFAQYCLADTRFCFPLPDTYTSVAAAPLLCAGLIGYRSFRMSGDAEKIGIFGFGAAAHLICQLAVEQGRTIYAFTRDGDAESQEFARKLGASWAGSTDERPPVELDAAIIFAPVGPLVPVALRAVRKGGVVVCGGIYMSDIPAFPYRDLWGERVLRSVANLTREDGRAFFQQIEQTSISTHTQQYALEDLAAAVADLRAGRLQGAAVITP